MLHGHRGRRQARPGGPPEVGALEVGPNQGRHEGVAAAGGVQGLYRGVGQVQPLAGAVSGKDAAGSQGDEHPVEPGFQKGVRRPVQGAFIRDAHPGEELCLHAVGLEGVDAPQAPAQLGGLHRGDRVCKDGNPYILRQPAEALLRKVGVHHQQLACLQHPPALGQDLGGQVPVDVHVVDGQHHVTVLVGNEKIGGGPLPGEHRRVGDVDAQLPAYGLHLLGVHILAEGGDELHIHPHKTHVVGDVAAYPAGGEQHPPGVGVLRDGLFGGIAADVHVGAAHHRDIGGGVDDVPLAADAALFHQIGDVHRHAGAGDARLLRQLLLGDHRIFRDPVEDLPLALCHALAPFLSKT